ncbi:hypothetical protein [Streptomyces afghaniensis]|uniref:hypothetical protein n=1 Tax=Streptomyces afghaniensis TaxID=66865 RepID=UPI00278768E0|nr:hypothetical protein [Streptomyces afghaniensis]MDQ1018888.1 hypothetical protein [Streptomyces afghaniensis]
MATATLTVTAPAAATLTVTAPAAATARLLTGYGLVAGARADFMPNGPERESMGACASRAHWLAQQIERGEDIPRWRFNHFARQIDNEMTHAGPRQLAPRADEWIATYAG